MSLSTFLTLHAECVQRPDGSCGHARLSQAEAEGLALLVRDLRVNAYKFEQLSPAQSAARDALNKLLDVLKDAGVSIS